MKNYPYYTVTEYSDFKTFVKGLENSFSDSPAITVYSDDGNETAYSYSSLATDVRNFAEALIEKNLNGKHIGIVSENSYELLVAFLSITSVNGVAVMIDIEQTVENITAMLLKADISGIVASDSMFNVICPIAELKPFPIIAVTSRNDLPNVFSEYLENGRQAVKAGKGKYDNIIPDPQATAAIIYTSGTTSDAKPVMLSQESILFNAAQSRKLADLLPRIFTSLPMFHTYGLTCAVISSMLTGAHICINGNLKTIVRDIKQFNPDTVIAVPLIAEMLNKMISLKAEETEEINNKSSLFTKIKALFNKAPKQDEKLIAVKQKIFGDLKLIVSGGANLSSDISENLFRFGITTLQGYGITECSPLIAVNRNDSFDFTSVGRICPDIETKFVDGEIYIKGKNVMQGYYKNQELTAEVLEDGWFRTGDLGFLDKNDFLHITGRKKNLIVLKNGKKISPEEFEDEMKKLPGIKDVMVYGAPTGTASDEVTPAAMIYPDPDYTENLSQYEILDMIQRIIDDFNSALPSYKQIQKINIRTTEFDKTAIDKIKRHLAQ